MPLRLLSYVTDLMFTQVVDRNTLYGNKQVLIPAPVFYVLYNGEQKLQNRVLKLSDSYKAVDTKNQSDTSFELIAKVVDINYGSGEASLGMSDSLNGYAFLVAEIRKNIHSGMTRDEAIANAIELCIKQDILQEFLTKHYLEVVKMLSWEYDAAAEKRVLLQEGRLEGIELLAKLLREGMPFDDALETAKRIESPESEIA